jgi:hypothetical protein
MSIASLDRVIPWARVVKHRTLLGPVIAYRLTA